MQVPEIAYNFAVPKDTAGPMFEVFVRQLSDAGTASTFTIDVTGIPKDRILVLTNIMGASIPGATQWMTSMNMLGFTAAGLSWNITYQPRPLTADRTELLNWAGTVYLMGPGASETIFRAAFGFNAGVNSNNVSVGLHGIVIPRGNSAQY